MSHMVLRTNASGSLFASIGVGARTGMASEPYRQKVHTLESVSLISIE